ncbi:MAG: helix-turn-helix transcriptional regulator [Lachnospiraceae bacterium]
MANFTVGNMIREARIRQKISQEELSDGICTPSTLSRIENGVQMPGKRILEALTQRLGITETIYNTYSNPQEIELYEVEQNLMRSLGKRDFTQAQLLKEKLKQKVKQIKKKDIGIRMEEQYLLFAEAMIEGEKRSIDITILEKLIQALRITVPEFDGKHIKNHLLTFQEITILNNIACVYYALGKRLEAIRLLIEVKEYIEFHVQEGEASSVKYPMVIQNIATWLGKAGQYEEVLKFCQAGIAYCIEYGKLSVFPLLLFNQACALAELGQVRYAEMKFHESAIIFQATNQREYAEKVKTYTQIHYHMTVL